MMDALIFTPLALQPLVAITIYFLYRNENSGKKILRSLLLSIVLLLIAVLIDIALQTWSQHDLAFKRFELGWPIPFWDFYHAFDVNSMNDLLEVGLLFLFDWLCFFWLVLPIIFIYHSKRTSPSHSFMITMVLMSHFFIFVGILVLWSGFTS